MAYDEILARQIRALLITQTGYVEKKMFGGIGFMLDGNLACGVIGEEMIVRVGPEGYETALEEVHVSVFDFTGRPMTGWVKVSSDGIQTGADLQRWVRKGSEYARSLPSK